MLSGDKICPTDHRWCLVLLGGVQDGRLVPVAILRRGPPRHNLPGTCYVSQMCVLLATLLCALFLFCLSACFSKCMLLFLFLTVISLLPCFARVSLPESMWSMLQDPATPSQIPVTEISQTLVMRLYENRGYSHMGNHSGYADDAEKFNSGVYRETYALVCPLAIVKQFR